MSNEIRVSAGLTIQKRDSTTNTILLEYQSRPSAIVVDMDGGKGPTPGAINVSREGTTVAFGELGTPGWVRIMNIDSTYSFEWGVWNPAQTEFYPVGELAPGEFCVFKFSPNLREEYSSPGTATGTGAAGSSEFRLKADWDSGTSGANALVEAFER